MIDFISFGALAYHIGGRGNETSTRQFYHFNTTTHYSMGLKGTLLKLYIHREKTYSQQSNTLFPYVDLKLWWKDVYFNLALSVLMKCHNQQSDSTSSISPLFPEFYNAGNLDSGKLLQLEKNTTNNQLRHLRMEQVLHPKNQFHLLSQVFITQYLTK